MSPPKQYKAYLRDASVGVPQRTRHRQKQAAQASSIAASQEPGTEEPRQTCADPRAESWQTAPAVVTDEDAASHENITFEAAGNDSDQDSSSEQLNARPAETGEQLYPGSKITQQESLLLLMGHILRHHSSREATESLLQVLDQHLPPGTTFAKTKYLFFKQFATEQAQKFFYCKIGKCFLGKVPETDKEIQCPACNALHSISGLTEEGSYFFYLGIESQLRNLLLDPSLHLKLAKKSRTIDVCDITQSKAYNELGLGEDDISLSWNTDGVPQFKSSKYSIWPLQLQINELPFEERVKHILLAGLWFGESKPDVECFLKPFIEEMNRLSDAGFSWRDQEGVMKHTHVFPGPCVVDTVARAMLLNMNQFNGEHGCAWCIQKGEVVRKGEGHVRVYPVKSLKNKMRTDSAMRKHAHEADSKGLQVNGIKGSTILLMLSFFKFPFSFVVDYMHAVCSGFVRATACMWLDHKAAFPYSLGGRVEELDKRLKKLQPVCEMSRLPRSLTVRKYWKSSEWRNWLLYFSPVVLRGILPAVYYRNWLKFVRLMHFLLADSVPSDQLRSAQKEMTAFLKEYQELYGKQYLSFNAHSLLHLVDCVREWGPLWNFSAYPYEDMNGRLSKLVNGTRHAHLQIIEKFLISSAMPRLCARYNLSSPVQYILATMLKGYKLRVHCSTSGRYTFFGKGVQSDQGWQFSKAAVKAYTLCVQKLDKSRRANSYVQVGTSSRTFGRITSIVRTVCQQHTEPCECIPHVFLILKELSVRQTVFVEQTNCSLNGIFRVGATSRTLKVDAAKVCKCVALKLENKLFLSPLHSNYATEAV